MTKFDTERRGRTLFQFCRDEGVDCKSLMAYKRPTETKGKGRKKTAASCVATDYRPMLPNRIILSSGAQEIS
ncbi:MAG: hypothetical protein K2K98_10310 [Muribaculaceae bacterium]|nr:hypothetical protein [Muribaculaceae bacterium]